eukprot:scaffold1499_cov170-Amphora_coffeaeformis.AAC.4
MVRGGISEKRLTLSVCRTSVRVVLALCENQLVDVLVEDFPFIFGSLPSSGRVLKGSSDLL